MEMFRKREGQPVPLVQITLQCKNPLEYSVSVGHILTSEPFSTWGYCSRHPYINKRKEQTRNIIMYYILSDPYTYVCMHACMKQYTRGLWSIRAN